MKIISQFLKYLKPYWWKEVVIFLLIMIETISSLAFPYIMKIIIDEAFPQKDYTLLIQMVLLMVIISSLGLGFSFFSGYLYTWVSNRIMVSMRDDLFQHLIKLPMSFFDQHRIGDIVHRLNSEVDNIQIFITSSALRLVNSCLTISGLTIALCWLNYRLFLISLFLPALVAICVKFFQPRIRRITEHVQFKGAEILDFLIDRFEKVKQVQIYNGSDHEARSLGEKLEDLCGLNMDRAVNHLSMRSISIFIMSLTPILIFGLAGPDVMDGVMSLGALLAFVNYLYRIFDPFRELNRLYLDLVRAYVSMQRVFEFMCFSHTPSGDTVVSKNLCSISFRNVSFGYSERAVLQNFTFEFQRGKNYALVGASGCGKSTVIDLLCQFYRLTDGKILIGDIDSKLIDTSSLRDRIGLVTQSNQLFDTTILNNIRYGQFNSTDEDVNQAVNLSGLRGHGIDSEADLEKKAVVLSGGQKQRVAIARAIHKDADILILDEATSALDSDQEREILENLCQLYCDKMIIFISHRLSAVKYADEIVCVKGGCVVEHGHHDDLVRKRGFYWRLFKEQLETERSDYRLLQA